MSNSNKIKDYYDKMRSLPLSDPRYIDPLYLPYHTNREISPLKSPLTINSGYPLNDPYRRHLGKGLAFRSRYFGFCPPGYVNLNDKNSNINTGMCYPVNEENDNPKVDNQRFTISNNQPLGNMPPISGTFYSSIQDKMNPPSWLNSYGDVNNKVGRDRFGNYQNKGYATTPYNTNLRCKVGDMRSLIGKNEGIREDIADCFIKNFF